MRYYRAVKKLVGELDFSFHVVSTQSKSISDGSATPRSASAFYASAT